MQFRYGEHDGEHMFLGPDELFPSPEMIQFVIQYGQEGLDALSQHPDEQIEELIEQMIQAGLLEREADGSVRMTPRMVRGIRHRMFLEIFRDLQRGGRGSHQAIQSGRSNERIEGTKPYEFGDPLSELSLNESMRNAMKRLAQEGFTPGGSLFPIRFTDRDFELFQTESTSDSAIVILVDLSGSMMRYGRYIQAKRVTMGMKALIEEKYPLDRIHFVGFSSKAERIHEHELPLIMPKPITVRDWEVRLRVPLAQSDEAPPHFTNLQHGLRTARKILRREGAANKQIFIITDGQPTAHVETSKAGEEMLYLLYPPSKTTWDITLKEAWQCVQEGIRLSTFALIEEYQYMEWVGFVEQLTRLTRGVAFYCTAGDLPGVIMDSYLSGKKERQSIGMQ